MASSLASPFRASLVLRPCPRKRFSRPLKVKAQGFRDEGRSRSLVDADMALLRKKMEELRVKERLEKCCRRELGWNYSAEYNPELQRGKAAAELFKLMSLSLGTVVLIFFSGTAFLCLASLIAHL